MHLGGIRLDVTAERTEEIELRGASGLETRADAVLMIEAIGRTELESILPKTLADVEASGVIKAELGQFTLAYFVSA